MDYGRPAVLRFLEGRAMLRGLKKNRCLGDIREAPWHFRREMERIDEKLSAHWNRIKFQWQIFFDGKVVMTVVEPGIDVMELTDVALCELRRADAKRRGLKKVLEEPLKQQAEAMRKKRKDFESDVESFSHESAAMVRHDIASGKILSEIGSRNIPKEDLRIDSKIEAAERDQDFDEEGDSLRQAVSALMA